MQMIVKGVPVKLNEYENLFELYRQRVIFVWILNSYEKVLYTFSCLFNRAFGLGKFKVCIYFGPVNKTQAHALSVKILRFEPESKIQSKWVIR
jgi:hypothetical protein